MAEGRSRDAWNHTSATLAMLVNANPFRSGGKAATPSDFHPHVMKHRHEKKSGDDEVLRVKLKDLSHLIAVG